MKNLKLNPHPTAEGTISNYGIRAPNIVTNKGDYYISYNPVDISVYGDSTTAIVVGYMEHFYILNGNHEKELCMLGSLQECLKYFEDNKSLINKYSEKELKYEEF